MESSEIDLTEFQEENLEDVDIGENGEARPDDADAGAGADDDTTNKQPGWYFFFTLI